MERTRRRCISECAQPVFRQPNNASEAISDGCPQFNNGSNSNSADGAETASLSSNVAQISITEATPERYRSLPASPFGFFRNILQAYHQSSRTTSPVVTTSTLSSCENCSEEAELKEGGAGFRQRSYTIGSSNPATRNHTALTTHRSMNLQDDFSPKQEQLHQKLQHQQSSEQLALKEGHTWKSWRFKRPPLSEADARLVLSASGIDLG